ncbi:hypothetical protein ACGFRB_14905 [Streptomyces sp. NPDC048718]|uniref:hypothetical protein n=1 Tax=Streptomyces sp. NPDC048718 TaxID=3365587 RepID=UPI003719D2EF
MRVIRAATSAALLAVAPMAALLLTAPAATADDTGPGGGFPRENGGFTGGFPKPEGSGHGSGSFAFSVTPRQVAPGGTVTLKADGCRAPVVNVESDAFDSLTLRDGRPGTARVDPGLKHGERFEVTFDCKGERGSTTLTVVGGGGHDQPGRDHGHEPGRDHGRDYGRDHGRDHGGDHEHEWMGGRDHEGRPPFDAHKGVNAGFGSVSGDSASDGGPAGLGTAAAVAGGVLIAGALGAAVVLTRRRERTEG